MSKLTVYDFPNKRTIASIVDKFVTSDLDLTTLRQYLVETLSDRKDVSAVEAANLILPAMYKAGFIPDEVEAALNVLFISNSYFASMVVGIAKSQSLTNPNAGTVQVEGGQSVFVGEEKSSEVQPETKPLQAEVDEPYRYALPLIPIQDQVEFRRAILAKRYAAGEVTSDEAEHIDAEIAKFAHAKAEAVVAIAFDLWKNGQDFNYVREETIEKWIAANSDVDLSALEANFGVDFSIENSDKTVVTVLETAEEVVAVDFNDMNIFELKDYAEKNNIDLGNAKKKPAIVAKLIEVTKTRNG